MKTLVAYKDAVDLLAADHKAVKKMFIDFDALCEDAAPADAEQKESDYVMLAFISRRGITLRSLQALRPATVS
jgi:hypothetical protein